MRKLPADASIATRPSMQGSVPRNCGNALTRVNGPNCCHASTSTVRLQSHQWFGDELRCCGQAPPRRSQTEVQR